MKINWILRLQNKSTLLSLLGILIVAIYQGSKILGLDIPVDQKLVLDFCENIITVLCIVGIVVDPTTEGISDSKQALTYTRPKQDQ